MTPLVSVCIITFNQEKYVRQTVNGVLRQKTDFEFEVLAADDASLDSTGRILADTLGQAGLPGAVILRKENLGMVNNFKDLVARARGKYLAICEGDDYWTDGRKLQKQVDYMERHPECSITWHPVKVEDSNGVERTEPLRKVPAVTYIDELAKGNYIHTLSAMYRLGPDLLEDFQRIQANVGDYVLALLAAKKGSIVRLEEMMGVYRTGVGVFSRIARIDWLEGGCRTMASLSNYFSCKNTTVADQLAQKRDVNGAEAVLASVDSGQFQRAANFFASLDPVTRCGVSSRLALSPVQLERAIAAGKVESPGPLRLLVWRLQNGLVGRGDVK